MLAIQGKVPETIFGGYGSIFKFSLTVDRIGGICSCIRAKIACFLAFRQGALTSNSAF
jgi:hypothetical protein